MTEKQYPELPDPTARRSYDNLLKRARYDAVPITSTQPGIYSHTRMFTEDQTRAFADATCAMRAEQAAPAAVARPSEDAVNRASLYLARKHAVYLSRESVRELLAEAAPAAQGDAEDAASTGFFLQLPQRPKPEAPAGTVGLDWDAYNGAQILAYGRDCSDAAIVATQKPGCV